MEPVYFFAILLSLVISIMMIIAILKIPAILRCIQSQLKLTAMIAAEKGIEKKKIYTVMHEAGLWTEFRADVPATAKVESD